MKIKLLLTIIFITAIAFGCETASNIKLPSKNYFLKYYGGDGNQYAVDLHVSSDGTFYILGNSVPPGQNQQVYLVHADAQGNMLDSATVFGTSGSLEAKDFQIVGDSIVVVGNETYSNGSKHRIFLARFPTSKINNYKTSFYLLNKDSTKDVFANAFTALPDGGYIISGYTNYVPVGQPYSQSGLHIRLDKNLNQLSDSSKNYTWNETTANGSNNAISKIIVSPDDSSFYCFGYSNSSPLGATDYNFQTFGLQPHGGYTGVSDNTEYVITGSDEYLTKAIKVSPGGYLIAGVSLATNQTMNVIIKKLKQDVLTFNDDVSYTYQTGSLGKPASTRAQFATACQTNSASGFFVLSNTYNSTTSGASDIYLQKLDLSLNEVWNGNPRIFGGDGEDTAAAVAELEDGHIMVLGTMNIGNKPEQFKIVLMKLNSAGQLAD